MGWAGALACVAGGVLWSLSPLGAYLSEVRFHTPNVFWKLFPSAPLLLLIALVGLRLRQTGRAGWPQKAGFLVALLGLALILAGDVGVYWLGIDDVFLMSAPAYRALRLGLLLLGVGCVLFGVGASRDGTLPLLGALPFSVGALAGLISFGGDLGSFGTVLWILFGIGWAWLGFSLLVAGIASPATRQRTGSGGTPSKNPAGNDAG